MKKFLSLAVAALLTISAVVTNATAAKFTDVDASNDALNDAVELLVALGVTKGTSETEFGAAQNVTREQMAAFIYRMMKAGKSVEGGVNSTSFTDLEDPTFYFMISWANTNGIIKGRSATSFDPKGGIVLQDAYTMIVRALGYDDGTLAYPISYISIAEDLGLDEDLPATVGYTDTLTRGDLAIILANMFDAEMAESEIKYESEPILYCPVHKYNVEACDPSLGALYDPNFATNNPGATQDQIDDNEYYKGFVSCETTVVSGPQTPKEVHKTVAEEVFEVIKVTQRVVATPNYSFDGNTMPDEDVEMIVLKGENYVTDYNELYTVPDLEERNFEELGLDGSADDYFLSDIVMFVKKEDKEWKIFGATAAGTKTTVDFADVEFGLESGTAAAKYYDDEDKEYKKLSGKVTLGDTVTYLYDAPYSFAKDVNKDKYNAQFITLGAYDDGRDVEEGVVDVNYSYVKTGRAVNVNNIIGTYTPKVEDDPTTPAVNEETPGFWTYDGVFSQAYFNGLGEVDVYDCDGDGRPEYLFVKNYVVGTINTEEDNRVYTTAFNTAATTVKDAVIYTDMSIVEGAEFANKDIVLAYVNDGANYVKVAEVLEGAEASVTTQASDYVELSTGEKVFYENAQAVVGNGAMTLGAIYAGAPVNFNVEDTYYFAANGTLVYSTATANTSINLNENYVVVVSGKVIETTQKVDGKLVTASYIEIYNDGEIKAVEAKKVVSGKLPCDPDTPATYDSTTEVWNYAPYVSKLATAKSDKNGAYYFDIVDVTDDVSAPKWPIAGLAGTDEEAEYRYSYVGATTTNGSGATVPVTVGFEKVAGNIYTITGDAALTTAGITRLYVKDYTQIIIKSLDKTTAEPVYTLYNAENLPDIKKGTQFANVSYVLLNNPKSNTNENLVVFYGELNDELVGDRGKVADVRIVKGAPAKTTDADGATIYTYDVFNPFEGKIVTGIEASDSNGLTFGKFDIVGLTTEGYIDNTVVARAGNAYKAGTPYNTDGTVRFVSLNDTLGFSTIAGYDETTGYLEINETIVNSLGATVTPILQVTDETVVTFADYSAETIKVVDAAVLGSTATTYRQNSDKAVDRDIQVVLCIEEDETEDETGIFYNVKFAMIVRD